MTRITDLTSLNPSSDSIFPVVKETDGVTTKMSVSQYRQLIEAPAGDGDAPGGFLQKTSLYGVPSKINLVEKPQISSGTVNVGDVFIATHKSINAPRASSDPSDGYNPKDFIAKGLHLKVTAVSSTIDAVAIINPGQMYKVGDEVQLLGAKAAYSPDPTVNVSLTGGTIRIDRVEPFIVGPMSNNVNLGGATNKHIFQENPDKATNAWNHSSSGAVDAGANEGVPPRMHLDPSSPLFYDYHGGTAANAQGYMQNAYRSGGSGSIWGGQTGWASNISSSSISVAVPGVWFVISCSREMGSYTSTYPEFVLNENSKEQGTNWSTPVLINDAFPSASSVENLVETVGTVGGISPIMKMPSYISGIHLTTNAPHPSYDLNGHHYYPYNTTGSVAWEYCPKPLVCTQSTANSMLTKKPSEFSSVSEWDAHWGPPGGSRSDQNPNNTIYFAEKSTFSSTGGGNSAYSRSSYCNSFFLVPATDILPVSPVL